MENFEIKTDVNNNEIRSMDYLSLDKKGNKSYCSYINIFDKKFKLKGKTEEELKNKKEEFYLYIHEMIVSELQKLTLQDEKDKQKQKHLK